MVALRKESVDRNSKIINQPLRQHPVALRKESVDRNEWHSINLLKWSVALRKESVDRNMDAAKTAYNMAGSLSARRAWIEMKCM